MVEGLTSGARPFRCPHCGETINTTMTQCRFCLVPVSSQDAEAAAETLGRINDICSQADYVMYTSLGVPVVFLLAAFVPFLGMPGMMALVALLVLVPVLGIRWWSRYRTVREAGDEELKKARVSVIVALIIWGAIVTTTMGSWLLGWLVGRIGVG